MDDQPMRVRVAAALMERRKSSGQTVAAFYNAAGVTRASGVKYERADRDLDFDTLDRICRAAGKPLVIVFGGSGGSGHG